MDNKPQQLWDGKREAPKGLRLPNTPPSRLLEESKSPAATPGNAKKSSNLPPQKQDVKTSKSRLSADAPEFFPSYYQSLSTVNATPANATPANSASSIQNRLKKHKVTDSNSAQQSLTDSVDDFVGSPDDIRLNHLIDTLTKDPGQFSDLLDIFMDTLCPYFGDVLVLSRAAQLLVQQVLLALVGSKT